ncbi:hypothetical protein CCO03_04890 [Comamonas serinivorans]|uniref:IPTL-CTERM protein sorting domain-containing protein n=1 Tax=Comamonas serinivorans TaxID=1082851 RepID=A0A1Y0EKX5_9BURK|nr:hypothetical protein CCO03_04890 [Comamonas serinivorans]
MNGTRQLSNVNSDVQGGSGGVADSDPILITDFFDGIVSPPIDGSAGWVRLTFSDAPVVTPPAPAPVPALGMAGVVSLSALMLGMGVFRRQRLNP